MLTSKTQIQEIIELAPEWKSLVDRIQAAGKTEPLDLLNEVGAEVIFIKALSLKEERGRFLVLITNCYLQPHLHKMLNANQNLRRFWGQRRMGPAQQKDHTLSFSMDLAKKMEGVLIKQLNKEAADGFKVLLPAYIQRSVHNACVDYIRDEASWERSTLQDRYLDPSQDDPREIIADDLSKRPDHMAISNEQVGQLNQLRVQLESMLKDASNPMDALQVVDCMFGMGLTDKSVPGQEMTMRECCDKLNIHGDTQARKIARCQVLLDKGLDLIRQKIRETLPDIVDSWQGELNVNSASRRELAKQLGMTEGEVGRLIKGRQYHCMDELVDRGVVKSQRLGEIASRGGVAAFVPVDINSATVRDMIDILGMVKQTAQKLAAERPFSQLKNLVKRDLLSEQELARLLEQGAVLKTRERDSNRLDLNSCDVDEIIQAGIAESSAQRLLRGRPFLTWSELEEFLGGELPDWSLLRQKFCLGIAPG